MSVDEFPRVTVATVRGEADMVVWQGTGGDYWVADEYDGYRVVDCAESDNVADVRPALVLPLPPVERYKNGYVPSAYGPEEWVPDSWTDMELAEIAGQVLAQAGVYVSIIDARKAAREAMPDLTEDLKAILAEDRDDAEMEAALQRIRSAIANGARIVEGGAQ